MSHLLPCGLALLAYGCGGGGGGGDGGGGETTSTTPPTASATAPVIQTHSQIASLIYSDSQRTPSGFYTDTTLVFSGYAATSHLKTTDVNPQAVLRHELCSDDFNQALQWSETANGVSGDNAALTGNETTSRYFEFARLRSGTPQGYLRQRIYRCTYLNRSTVDLQAGSGDAGTLNMRPLDALTLKQASEYLWQFTTYNNFGNVVLGSSGSTGANLLTHSVIIASLTRGGNAGSCDTINVFDWKHSVNTGTGAMTLSVTPLFNFRAQESSGAVSVCSN